MPKKKQPKVSTAAASPPLLDLTLCGQRVQEWYPHLLQQTYFVPAVYMNRTQHAQTTVAGRTVYELQPLSQESDARDDTANRRVLGCIQQLTQGQVMFVISELEFNNYLKNLSPAVVVPKPQDPDMKKQKKHDGDFDLLIVHRKYGVFAGEIKAFGDATSSLHVSQTDQRKIIAEKVQKAIGQLEKSRDVLQYLLSQDPSQPRIRTTMMMPYLSREQLRQVLGTRQQLKQKLCSCLGVDVKTDPTDLCFTSDDVDSPHQWWQHCMTRDGPDPCMTDDIYQDLVSRFGGPATSVTVAAPTVPRLAKATAKTRRLELPRQGHGVAETASRFTPADIVLHPSQLHVLHDQSSPLVFLCGPPGTGKSLLLILKGLDMLQNRRMPVLVLGTREGNMTSSSLLFHQLQEMAGPDYSHLLRYHSFLLPMERHRAVREISQSASQLCQAASDICQPASEVNQAASNLSQSASEVAQSASDLNQSASDLNQSASDLNQSASEVNQSASEVNQSASEVNQSAPQPCQSAPTGVFVIVDEACDDIAHNSELYFGTFCTELCQRLGPGLHLWAASMYHRQRPPAMTEVQLRIPLRTPPSVTRHVQQHRGMGQDPTYHVLSYQEPHAPLPADGPEPIEVTHRGEGHDPALETCECQTCGREVARILRELGVGETGQAAERYPQLPRYRDVFILTWNTYFHDEERDLRGEVTSPASGLLRGLRAAGVPVTVLGTGDAAGARRVATMAGPDHVIAAGGHFVQGLERMIVVYVQTSRPVYDDLDWARLFLISRCTAQLVWVKP